MIGGVWRQVTRGLRALVERSATDREIADEVAHYLEESTRSHMARGLSPAAARRAARLEVGEVAVREEVRGCGWENEVERVAADVRLALRQLRRSPGFAAVALVTIGLGVGGATAIYGAVRPILFDPLPYPSSERVRAIWEVTPDDARRDATFGLYRGLSERVTTFEALAVHRPWQPTLSGVGRPERMEGQRVSADYFRVLGVGPVVGRDFEAADDRPGAPDVVILGHGVWERHFGGDAGAIGRTIRLDGTDHTVVGVLPASFENVLAPGAEIWTPLQYDLTEGRAWGHHLGMVGRLTRGTAPEAAVRELNAAGRAAVDEHRPVTYAGGIVWVAPSLRDDVTRGVRAALLAVLGAMLLLLAIACVNVANLLLGRGVRRRGELALRAALGANRHRLVRQLLTESLVLAGIGGALGLLAAALVARVLAALAPPGLPRAHAIGMDPGVLLFGAAVTGAVTLVVGIIPALRVARSDRLAAPGPRRTAGRDHRRLVSALVVAQVALAVVLLVGSGLLLRSLQRLLAVPPGFDTGPAVTMQIQASGPPLEDDAAARRFFDDALAAIRRVPGVTAAGLTSQLPLSGDHDTWGLHFEAVGAGRPDGDRGGFRYAVSARYIETMGIPLRSGRSITEGDQAGAPLVALISESLARRDFGGGDPLGARLRIGPADSDPFTVVGVVGDVRQQSLALGGTEAVYVPAAQWRFADRTMSLVVRAGADPGALVPALREAVWSVDGNQPVTRVARLDQLVAASAAERRFTLVLFQAFALLALVLAAGGLYGVMAGSVAERTRELGIRAALGAGRGAVVRLVLGEGLRLTAAGVALGLAGAAVAGPPMRALLYDVAPWDPITYAVAIALLVVVALTASGVPAWRAARVDPTIPLRSE